jgi:predicted PurR-regulated permease PerM
VTLGGGLFGLPGVLLSVPTASVLYTLLKEDVTARLKPQKTEPDESAEA